MYTKKLQEIKTISFLSVIVINFKVKLRMLAVKRQIKSFSPLVIYMTDFFLPVTNDKNANK